MPTVQLPDGTTALFPNSMSPADIQGAIESHFKSSTPSSAVAGAGPLGIPGNPAPPIPAALQPGSSTTRLGQFIDEASVPVRSTNPVANTLAHFGAHVIANSANVVNHPVDAAAAMLHAANPLDASNLPNSEFGVPIAAAKDPVGFAGDVVGGQLLGEAGGASIRALDALKTATKNAALGDPNAAILQGLQVGPKSPKALATISAADNARPFLQGAQNLEDLQARIAPVKAEIWKPYQQAVDAIGDRVVDGPSGPQTVRELEAERLQLSALNRGIRSGDPAALQLAQQKGMSAAQLLDHEADVKAALDPELESTGINPQLIRKVFGSVSQVGARVAGKTTLIEPTQPSGLGKIANLSLKQPLQAPGQIVSGIRDLLAGRPLYAAKPTDLGVREGFANAGPKPDFGSVQTTGVPPPNPPPAGLLNAPPIQLPGKVLPSQPPNFYYDTTPMRLGRLLNAPAPDPIQLPGDVHVPAQSTFRYDTTPMRQGRLLEAPGLETPMSSHVDAFPNQRPGGTVLKPRLAEIIRKAGKK